MKAKEKVVRNVESIFKKPQRAAVKLTLSERMWGEKNVADQNELYGENHQEEREESVEVPKWETKRVRLTIGVKPGEGREKKKKVQKVWVGNQATTWRWSSRYQTCDGTWLVWMREKWI